MTIEAVHRARWRKLFARATREPWAGSFGKESVSVIAAQSGHSVAMCHDIADLEFIAESRAGWPAALDALEQAEAERDRMSDTKERAIATVEVVTCQLQELRAEIAVASEGWAAAQNSAVTYHHQVNEYKSAITAERERYDVLRSALLAWKSNRYAPALLRVIEEHLK